MIRINDLKKYSDYYRINSKTVFANSRKWYHSSACIGYSVLYISDDMSGKMTDIHALSSSCIENERCQRNREIVGSICENCFAETTIHMYSDLGRRLSENTITLHDIIPVEWLPQLKDSVKIFRLEAFGDSQNAAHAYNLMNIARINSHVHFTVWTKNPVDYKNALEMLGSKPSNLTIIVSSLFKNVDVSRAIFHAFKFVDKVFNVWTDRETAEKSGYCINCRAIENGVELDRCKKCMKCYTHNDIKVINELLK